MTSVAVLKYTTPHGLQYYEKYKKTPLSAHNISNTSAHSGSHGFAVGSSSKGRFLVSILSSDTLTHRMTTTATGPTHKTYHNKKLNWDPPPPTGSISIQAQNPPPLKSNHSVNIVIWSTVTNHQYYQ
jgi:hypothetical protein